MLNKVLLIGNLARKPEVGDGNSAGLASSRLRRATRPGGGITSPPGGGFS